jgi:AcrR family transcriptional regulator
VRAPARDSNPSTSDVLLDAAEVLFAERGFPATSVKDIGQAAGINPALLYYYFGDKTGLYRAVLRRIGQALLDQGRSALVDAPDPEAVIRRIVRAQAAFISENPRAAAIIIRELIDHQAKHGEPMVHQLAAELFQPLVRAITQGQERGRFRAGLDPRFAAVSIVAQNVYFSVGRAAVRILLGQPNEFPLPADVIRFGEHAAEFALAALRRQPGE